MDTIQQAVNTFTDGLNTDLHPLTTPNTVLTDCINGTVITYNGNEYILQNDMGNYKLEKAQLPADYIPVGIKEYGNIIYIVSYNPIDKKCQIGSYPSPQTLFDNTPYGSRNENYRGVPVNELADDWYWTGKNIEEGITDKFGKNRTNVLFTNRKPESNLIILFPEKGDNKDTFLSPGDKYFIEIDNEDNTWKFQHCEYFTLTESKEAIKIEDNLIATHNYPYTETNDLDNVKWETPGWIGYKPSLLEPTSFDLYLTDIKVPSFFTNNEETGELNFTIQGQLTINTHGDWNEYYDKLKVYFDYQINSENWISLDESHTISEEGENPTNYGNTIDILTYNKSFKNIKVNKLSVINVRATPYIIEDGKGIIYDNLSVTYTINLGNLYNINDIKCFDVYKYLVDEDGVSINFSIESPTSKLGQITCRYRIWEINNEFTGATAITDLLEIDSLNMLGQNILSIDFEYQDWSNVKKEEIYLFELSFYNINDLEIPLYQNVQVLITSEVLNDFYLNTNRFQDLSMSNWTANISKYTHVTKIINELSENTKGCSKYLRISNINSIFTNEFYQQNETTTFPISNFINNLDNNDPAGDPETTNNDYETAINTIISSHDKELSISYYYGVLKAYYGNLQYELTKPIITDKNIGLWADVEWLNITESDVTSYINGTSSTKHYASPQTILNSNKIFDNSAQIVYARSLLGSFIADTYYGKEGDKWYLYKNLMYGLPGESSEVGSKWNIRGILQNQESHKWTNKELDRLWENSFTRKNYSKYVWKIGQTSTSNRRTDGYFIIDSLDFDFKELNGQRDRGNIFSRTIEWPTTDKFDTIIAQNWNNPWWGAPIYLGTWNAGNSEKFWVFPDKWTGKHYSGNCQNCAYLTIPCRDGNSKSLAIVKFFPSDFDGIFNGTFHSLSGNWKSTWFNSVNATTTKTSEHYIPNIFSATSNTQTMTQCIAAFLFAMGINLYGMYNIKDVGKSIINYSGSTTTSESTNAFNIKYTRKDTLNKLFYKGIDLKNMVYKKDETKVEWDTCLDKLINSIKKVDSNNFNINTNILKSNFSAVEIKTITQSYTYNAKKDFSLYDIKFISFISGLANKLQEKINDFEDSKNRTENGVYSEFKSGEIGNSLSSIASNLQFEFTNNRGWFYYKGMPDAQSGWRTESKNGSNFIRSLDWSNLISWNTLYTALAPSGNFKKLELE